MIKLQSMEKKVFHKVSLPKMNSELPDSNECQAPEQQHQN